MTNYGLPSREEILAQQRETAQQKDEPEETRRRVREAIGRVHGSSTSPMYVGDMPGAYPPVLSPVTQPHPNRGALTPPVKTDTGDEMTIWILWVVDDQDPDGVPWVAGAMDAATLTADPELWNQRVEQVRNEFNDSDFLITRTTVNYAKVCAAFEPLDI